MESKGPDLERTWLCSVMFTDMVNYSAQLVQQQIEWKIRFNHFLTEALADVDVDERYVLDTGDGAAVCFMGAPEPAMNAAIHLRERLMADRRALQEGLGVRIGLNLGPLRLMKDVNGRVNAVGEAINTAQRVMSFARPNEVLASRSFYDTVSCLSEATARVFRPLGIRKDKNDREHMLYQMVPEVEAGRSLAGPFFDQALLEKARQLLSVFVGPIAGRLVQYEAARAEDVEQLGRRLSGHIEDPRGREQFWHLWSREAGQAARGAAAQAGGSATGHRVFPPDSPVLATATAELARHIGPMAKLLVERAATSSSTLKDLVETLTCEIASEKDREAFRRAVSRAR